MQSAECWALKHARALPHMLWYASGLIYSNTTVKRLVSVLDFCVHPLMQATCIISNQEMDHPSTFESLLASKFTELCKYYFYSTGSYLIYTIRSLWRFYIEIYLCYAINFISDQEADHSAYRRRFIRMHSISHCWQPRAAESQHGAIEAVILSVLHRKKWSEKPHTCVSKGKDTSWGTKLGNFMIWATFLTSISFKYHHTGSKPA